MDYSIIQLLSLLFCYFYLHSCQGTLIQTPSSACNGEDVTVKCILDVLNTNDMFTSVFIRFIIANPAASLSENEVNTGIGDYFGVKLTRLTAMDDPSSSRFVQLVGSITLSSFNSTDEGLLLGCSASYFVNGNVSDTAVLSETIPLNQAAFPSPPVNLSADFNSTSSSCIIELSWIPGASDRSIQMYFLYMNGVLIDTISSDMNSYSHVITIQINRDYNYSVVAMSCAGNSTEATADPFSYGGYLLFVNSQSLSYNETVSEIYFNWTLSSNNENITFYLNYSLDLTYNHSNSSVMNKFSHTYSFSQLSSDTNYTQAITPPEFDKGNVDTHITACLQITKQCGQPVSGMRMCDYYESELHTIPNTIAPSVGAKKKAEKRTSDMPLEEHIYKEIDKSGKKPPAEAEQSQLKGFYADIDHIAPKPESVKRPDSIQETDYMTIQPSIDGPNSPNN